MHSNRRNLGTAGDISLARLDDSQHDLCLSSTCAQILKRCNKSQSSRRRRPRPWGLSMRLADRGPTGSRLCTVAALSMVLLVSAGGPGVAAVLSPPRVYPTVEVAEQRRATGPDSQAQTDPQLIYHGGPVGVTAGTPNVYLVFWGSQWGAETPT